MSGLTPAPVPSYDLVGPILQGMANAPGIWWNAFLQNPGPWLLVGAMFAGLLLVRVIASRVARQRGVRRR